MFFLGLASILQCWFIPGLILIKKFKFINSIFEKLFYSILLSVVLNLFIVIILIQLDFFDQKTIISIFIFEVVCLVYLYRSDWEKIKIFPLNITLTLFNGICFVLFATLLFQSVSNIGEIIYQGDPLIMWNKWGQDLYNSKYPSSLDYPLAYPSLISITYKFLNTLEVEFFARSLVLIYPLAIFLIFLLPRKNNDNSKILSISILLSILFLINQYRHTLFIGFVDPIIFLFSLAILYILITDQDQGIFKNKSSTILYAIIIATPSLLKQNGLLLTGGACAIIFFNFLFKQKNKHFQENLLLFIFLILLISTPWYLLKIYNFLNYDSSSNIISLTSLQFSKPFSLKILRTLNLVFGWSFVVIFPLLIISYKDKLCLKLLSFLIIPYYLVWAYFYGNDARNFALMLPFISYCIVYSGCNILKILKKSYVKKVKLLTLFFFIFLTCAVIYSKRNDHYLITKNYEKSRERTAYKKVNVLLYHYKDTLIKKHTIYFTNMNYAELPQFKNISKQTVCIENNIKKIFKTKKRIFMLTDLSWCNFDLKKYLATNKSLKILFESQNHILVSN
ncbi:hypothetical protein [Candidatus Pelagibacter sp. HIMB1517]|uniref:hypothetical protein n=1 Tax=Candidatus Pelagibacter sp. HIMB1517 TaxID=3413341 RepID=UPI003F860FF5